MPGVYKVALEERAQWMEDAICVSICAPLRDVQSALRIIRLLMALRETEAKVESLALQISNMAILSRSSGRVD